MRGERNSGAFVAWSFVQGAGFSHRVGCVSECGACGTRGRLGLLAWRGGRAFSGGGLFSLEVLCVGECDWGHVCWRSVCGAWLVCALGRGGVAFVRSPGAGSQWTGGGEGAGYRSCSGGVWCSASSSEPVDPLMLCYNSCNSVCYSPALRRCCWR